MTKIKEQTKQKEVSTPYFYSTSTGGFYTPDIHGENMPADKVEITEEEWRSLMDGQANGKIIKAVDGKPSLVEPPPYVAPAPLTAAEKLKAAGLTVDELKGLLGL